MSKALSLDLRTLVLAAVAEGASYRVAAARFGVSAASVSRWRALERTRATRGPARSVDDRRSGRVEAQAGLIQRLLQDTPVITVEELRQALANKVTVSAMAPSSGSSPDTASRAKTYGPSRLQEGEVGC